MSRIDNSKDYEKIKLDVKDKKILDLLSENSRMPISTISKKVEISREVTNYKINRLLNLGIIENFIPKINFRKLGFNTYHIFLMVDASNNLNYMIDYLKSLKETLFIFEYSDKWDLEIVVLAKNIRKLDKLVSSIQAKFSTIIMERIELLEINTYQSILFSYYFNKDKINNLEQKKSIIKTKIDNNDLDILKELSINSRKSTYLIASQMALNADTIGLRIKKLQRENIISKFSIQANLSKLGYNWHTFCIKMKTFDEETQKTFKSFVEHHPRIIRVAKTFGDWDILMYILSEKPNEFHKTIKEIKSTFSQIIKSHITFVAYKEHYYNPIPPIIFE